ncbi:TPA: Bax inhibitor-1/YccA family protein [Candidatus Galligastranaerophilus gallistercoris]|nr:Bax inhibitor-1/YccA family protein [Candidatus Galligastranaerophilus gallistercoris]
MSNPVFNSSIAEKFIQSDDATETMSIQGAVMKTFILLAILVASSVYTFSLFMNGFIDKVNMLTWTGLIGGVIAALIAIFNAGNKKILVPAVIIYSIFEGLVIGGISALYTVYTKGSPIVANAVCATFATMIAMLILYSLRIIKCTEKFKSTILIATAAVAVIYLTTFIVGFFNPAGSSLLMGSGTVGIGFSIIVCVIAALNLIIDFHVIENGANMNMPKFFEWYGAFGLMVTLIWLYIEILRLLAKFSDRN